MSDPRWHRKMLNLIDSGFQGSSLFRHMPRFETISYQGRNEEKVRTYLAVREGRTCEILSLSFIRHDEKILWEAIEDFVKRGTSDAVAAVRGTYIFDLLAIDIHREIKSFKHSELTAVIVNESRRLAPAQTAMVKYSSVYALISKKAESDWGKIMFKSAVDVFKDKPQYLDLLIKRRLKEYVFPVNPVILLLHDLSQNPVFDPNDATQQARLKKVMADSIPRSIEFIPEVYIQDKNGARELFSGSVL